MIVGGLSAKLAVVVTASSLLLFAANTAIIGSYHVFLALVNGGFLPRIIAVRNPTFNTPHIAVAIATVVPVLVILFSAGEMKLLGDMYAFGLLGAFVFSSLSLDAIRWRLGRRDPGFWLGVFTTLMVMVAWAINLVEKPLATYFGGAVTIDRHVGCRRCAASLVRRFACANSGDSAPPSARLSSLRGFRRRRA